LFLCQLLAALHLSLVSTLQRFELLVALAFSFGLLLLRSQDLVLRLKRFNPRLQTKNGAVFALEDVFELAEKGWQRRETERCRQSQNQFALAALL
jgi:hypothetical protein